MKVSILGGSGYVGGELLRLLLDHPKVTVAEVTSERLAGKLVATAHPNLRRRTDLRFGRLEDLDPCDLLFARAAARELRPEIWGAAVRGATHH